MTGAPFLFHLMALFFQVCPRERERTFRLRYRAVKRSRRRSPLPATFSRLLPLPEPPPQRKKRDPRSGRRPSGCQICNRRSLMKMFRGFLFFSNCSFSDHKPPHSSSSRALWSTIRLWLEFSPGTALRLLWRRPLATFWSVRFCFQENQVVFYFVFVFERSNNGENLG